ncbi:MAG: TonB-dependent receptor [Allosphingosinicella sp.]|uniref:TonB-dependent receptor n=1 Tax=Allosphingosinicella sp. TaxID=2823234 RepID=UPI003946173A
MGGPRTRGRFAAFTAFTAIAAALAFPAPALAFEDGAQPPTADPEVAAQENNDAVADQATASPAAQDDVLVVTARRRNETLQDVPGAVTAVGGESLDTLAVTDLRALSGRIPNFSVEQGTTSSSASQIFLRGIGIDNTGFNTDPNVGVYIDDIFVGRLIGSMVSAVDLERIEVLRGPQGTLYGRNSTAGAVKYVTRRPDLNDTSARLVATVGNFNRRTLRGTVNVPLIPGELAVMFNAQTHTEDGYITLFDATGNDTGLQGNGRDVLDARVSVLWQPTEELSVYLTGDLTRNRSGLQSLTPTNCAALGTRPGLTANGTIGQISAGQFERCPLFYNNPYASFIGPFPYDDPRFDSRGASASISYDLGFATLRSITGARGFNDVFASPLFAKPPPNVQVNLRNELQQSSFQQELQLASSGDSWLGYIAGLFYYHEDIRSIYQSQVGAATTIPYINDDRQLTDAYAAYGELYIRPVEGLELTVGGRMSWDEKQVERLLFSSPTATTPSLTYSDDISESHFTPRLGISYDTGPVLFYATYSEGYRAPGWANANPANLVGMQLEFGIETESSYEVGVRSQWFDRMLTLNASAFSAEYNNLGATLTAGGQTIVVTSDARIQGLELEGNLRPMQGLNIFGNLALLEDEYINPPQGQPYAMRLKHAPRTTWLLGADYETAVGAMPGRFFIGGDVNYVSSAFRNVANTIDQQSDAYTLVSARIGYRAEGDRWSLTLGGTNLTDEVYWLLGTQNQARSYQAPRRVFLTAEVRF